jgi:SAM-dependent methyltransferase
MNSEFYSKVAGRFGGYSSGAKRIEVFPDGDPEDAFDEITTRHGRADATLLDVGCADGRNLLRIAPAFTKVHAIDMASEMLDSAVRHRAGSGLDHVEFELRDASATGYPDEAFDVVTSRRGPLFTQEYLRVLKPGGSLVHLGIGEQDVRELKEVFGRGQLHGRWDGVPVATQARAELEDAGFVTAREQNFTYEEFFLDPTELDTFLHMVPIFEDYDSEADGELFSRYVARASSDRGVRLGRHWFLLHVRKPAGASHS